MSSVHCFFMGLAAWFKINDDDDWRPIESRLFKEPIIRPLKSKMAEIRHLENRHDVIFSCSGWSDLVKFQRLVQNNMSTAVIWSKSKPDVDFQYGGRLGEFNGMSSQSHVSHCRVLPVDEFTVMIPEPHATLQGVRIPSAILKIVFRHILFIFGFLKIQFGASGASKNFFWPPPLFGQWGGTKYCLDS